MSACHDTLRIHMSHNTNVLPARSSNFSVPRVWLVQGLQASSEQSYSVDTVAQRIRHPALRSPFFDIGRIGVES
jgi:hypothetical protein